jgi:hypothetical protein
MTRLEFRREFWEQPLTWGRPDSVPTAICSCCSGVLPDVPLILSNEAGWTLRLCDDCVDKWLGIAK